MFENCLMNIVTKNTKNLDIFLFTGCYGVVDIERATTFAQ